MGKKITKTDAIALIEKVFPGKFDFSKFEYKDAKTKVTVICKECGKEITQLMTTIRKYKNGCPYCSASNKDTFSPTKDKIIKNYGENRFDFSLVNYVNVHNPITLICNTCGTSFNTVPANLTRIRCVTEPCPCCYQKSVTKSQDVFILQVIDKFGDKFDFSKTEYISAKTKLTLICKDCGTEFQITPDLLFASHTTIGCPTCAEISRRINRTLPFEEFLFRSKQIHGNKYTYFEETYKNFRVPTKILCPEHGEFWQTPDTHTNGSGCPKCALLLRTKSREEFIKDAVKIHGNKYDYSKVNYINSKTPVCIICKEHGEFWQTPNNHLKGLGCPKCKQSKGEEFISNQLNQLSITYTPLKSYIIPNFNHKVIVDFYISWNSTEYIIEYNDRQHYEAVDYFGGEELLKKLLIRDNILREFCKDNNIKLIEYKFDLSFTDIGSDLEKLFKR